MKNSTQLLSSTLVIALSCFLQIANAQIVYTDVNPDQTKTCGSAPCTSTYNLNLNNDFTDDFSIVISKVQAWCPGCQAYKTNSSVTVTPLIGNATLDTVAHSGNVIGENLNWSTSLQTLASKHNNYTCVPLPPLGKCSWSGSATTSGSWNGQTNGYLPLKLIVGANTYYGWARLSVASGGSSFTIKDYAYNTIADQAILAGQTEATDTAFTTTGVISGSPFCAGETIAVFFTAFGTFNSGNVFTAQLSDKAGSFSNATSIGTLGSVVSGSISATLSSSALTGTHYRIRVISSDPSLTGTDNGSDFIINHGKPNAMITASGSISVCEGQSVSLSIATVTGGSYSWRTEEYDGYSSATTFNASEAGPWSCIVTNGCGADTSNAINVVINPLPAVSISTPNKLSSFCEGGGITLNATKTDGFTYQWKLNSVEISGATKHSYTTSAEGSYTVAVQDSNGCQSTSAGKSIYMSMGIPTTGITVNSSAASSVETCAGTKVTFKIANISQPDTYQWQKNGSNIQGKTNSKLKASAAGDYTCLVSNGCGSITSNMITLIANPLPPAAITPLGPTSICEGDSVILQANAGVGYSYQWWGGYGFVYTIIPGATSQTYTAKTSYKCYNVVEFTTAGCGFTSPDVCVNVVCKTGSEGLSDLPKSVSIYPNPFSQSTTISFSLPQSENVSLRIFDVEGRLIRTLMNENMSAGMHALTWDSRDENGNEAGVGIYFLKIEAPDFSQIVKLIMTK